MAYDPVVFISSTSDDLKEHREQAAKAALASGFSPRMMEYFPASGHGPSLSVCREMVAEAEVVVVLVAHRYGWVPEAAENPGAKSITWLECEHAWEVTRREVLAFLVHPACEWPDKLYESYRLVKEKEQPARKYNQIRREVSRNEKKLADFKQILSRNIRGAFTDALSVRPLVAEALAAWRLRHHPTTASTAPRDPEPYLAALEEETRQIRIKGLKTKRSEPYFFGIDEIYIPLTTLATGEIRDADRRRRDALEKSLSHRKVVIAGDPGSGKSTFLRRVAFELCRNHRGTRPPAAPPFLPVDDKRFPILIRVADLASRLSADRSPMPPDAPGWIPYFLGKQGEAYKWAADEAFFSRKLDEGGCLVMVDGLDEAPERRMRERIARIFERATQVFGKCDFLVSTRPQTNIGDSVLQGFEPVRIGDLELPEIRFFFDHFARALALSDGESKNFKDGLELALASRPEIREMAGNPVMLTALAVLQHNDQRLPEYRVELYGSILGWLAAARVDKRGLPAEKCLEYMRKLALHMQDAPEGRQVQLNKRVAAELFAGQFGGSVDAAEDLLERETQDSGIISSAGRDVKFWHLSFQEYLAAREIASLSDSEQIDRVVKSGKLYRREWREAMRLLGGLLCQQGEAKIEGLFKAILGTLGSKPRLPDEVRCVALLSAMMRDLARMEYQPKTPGYERTVRHVMGIFEAGEAEKIEIGRRAEAADLLGQVGDPRLEDDNWVEVPAGEFFMGAQRNKKEDRNYDPEADKNELPVHAVTLRGFHIGRYPVTVQEYGKFMADRGYEKPKHWAEEGFGKFEEPEDWEKQREYPNRPAVGVSWFEAAAYCSWKGGRLPTEAEWERAARGPQGERYPWGDTPPLDASRANYYPGVGHPTPVGLYPQGSTSETLCDMLGNVLEWCGDWYGRYGKEDRENPTGPQNGEYRVVRGGSWVNDPQYVRASYRNRSGPTYRDGSVGFRCAGELS